jgi:sodium transport system permease protein
MRLNLHIIGTLFRAEMRMVLRDRRILISSILVPLLLTPLMFLGANWGIKRREKNLREMVYHYAVTGSEASIARAILSEARNISRRNDPSRLALQPGRGRARRQQPTPGKFKFDEVASPDSIEALNKGEIQLVVQGLTAEQARQSLHTTTNQIGSKATAGQSSAKPEDDPESERPATGVPVVRLLYRADRDDSAAAVAEMMSSLDQVRRIARTELLQIRGFPVTPFQMCAVSEIDLASKKQVAGLALGRSLTLILLILILTSGAVVATDSIAGEKERGTLETVLTSAVSRVEILAAKGLVILAIALIITLIQTVNLLVYAGLKLIPVPQGLAAVVTLPIALLLLFLFLPVAALAANGLLLISGYARSYREAQMYFMPALLLGILPAFAPFLPGIPLRSIVVLMPVANVALAVKEILIGSFDWPMLGVSWLITSATAVWMTRLGVRFLSAERLISGAHTDAAEFVGGPVLFEHHVVRWFAVLWAALLIVSNYIEKTDLRIQIAINLVGLFFCASLLMIWRYRLDPRKALALRLPRPMVWLGVLFAVPGGLLTSLAIFHLSNLVMPMSNKMAESFNETVISPHLSLAQLLFFLAVMPGIFEEIAFRGLLLHGLRRRLHPVALAVVVGLTFGFFHVALFRFVPTSCLGMLFAAITMLTGSIYPAMLWHCLNNATGILIYKLQIPETDLPLVCYLAGVGMLAVAFWIFWRQRTPYEGLRWARTSSSAKAQG